MKNQLKIKLTCTVYRDKVTRVQAARWRYAGGRRVCGAGRIRENTGELLQPSPEMRYRRWRTTYMEHYYYYLGANISEKFGNVFTNISGYVSLYLVPFTFANEIKSNLRKSLGTGSYLFERFHFLTIYSLLYSINIRL